MATPDQVRNYASALEVTTKEYLPRLIDRGYSAGEAMRYCATLVDTALLILGQFAERPVDSIAFNVLTGQAPDGE
jgi:hypothetical protein